MNKTEEQAKKLWCCDGGGADNRNYRCLASECMAWRWAIQENGEIAYEDKPIDGQPGMFEHAPMGYCGLAGKPQS